MFPPIGYSVLPSFINRSNILRDCSITNSKHQISYNVSKMASGLGPTKFNGTLNILTTFRENN